MLRILTELTPEGVKEEIRGIFGAEAVEERDNYLIVTHRRPPSRTYVRIESTEEGTEVEVGHEYSLIWFSRILVLVYGLLIAVSVVLRSRLGILLTMLGALASYAAIYAIYGRREDRIRALITEALRGRVVEE